MISPDLLVAGDAVRWHVTPLDMPPIQTQHDLGNSRSQSDAPGSESTIISLPVEPA
jgi:hypothetical protein